jgi:delta24-sterol reductase
MSPSHEARVREVAAQVAARPPGARLTIRKPTPIHSVRDQAYKSGLHAVDVSALDQILEIDTAARVAVVEGQVTIGELSKATLARGWLPEVVPEFSKFTISGLINGEGIQSSAHRYGVFSQSLVSVELLLADGSTITASAEQHADVFKAVPESLGTLGIVTAATIKLVPAKPWVKCTYRRFESLPEYVAAFTASLGEADFHEGMIFGPRGYVLLTGEFVDEPGGLQIFDPNQEGGEYFYQHVRRCADRLGDTLEAIETAAYLTRMQRGLWWLMECHSDFPLLSETTWGRRHMDAAAAEAYNTSGFVSQGLTNAQRDRCLISQDMGVKLEQLQQGIEWVQSRLQVYPLWNCAVRQPEDERIRLGTSYLVDIGIYGEPLAEDYRHVRDMRALQQFVPAPSLWGVSYLTWEEIKAVNPARAERYQQVRALLNADRAFLHIKDKVVWIDPGTEDPGKIPMWRLVRTFGPGWRNNPKVYLLLLIVMVSKAIWRKPAIAR